MVKRHEVVLSRNDGHASARVEEREDGYYVTYEDYKKLEEEHRALVKRYTASTPASLYAFFDKVDQDD